MRFWNLVAFDELSPEVLESVGKAASIALAMPRRRRTPVRTTTNLGLMATAAFVAAISVTSLRLDVYGSDDALRLSSAVSISNVREDRPPLTLLFGAKHALKWDAATEQEMLTKAANALAGSTDKNNEANMIHAVLREKLPSNREEALDLASLGIKLG